MTAHNTNPAEPAATSAELTGMDALELSAAVKSRAVSCREVMQAFLAQISLLNQHVNAIVALRDEGELLAEADEYDRLLRHGEYRGVLHGFPHAVKDLSDTVGFATTKDLRYLSTIFRARTPYSFSESAMRAQSLSARPTHQNSDWVHKPTTRYSARPVTPMMPLGAQVVAVAAPLSHWRFVCYPSPTARTLWDRCAIPPRSTM